MIDYSRWDMQEELTLEVAACLWIDREPLEYGYSSNHDVRYQAVLKTLYEAVDKKRIGHKTLSNREESKSQLDYDLDDYMGPMGRKKQVDNPNKIIAVERRHLKAWCENNGHKPKFLFPEMRKTEPSNTANHTQNSNHENPTTPSEKPAYLDETHPMFSPELFIAIEAWEQVLSSKPNRPKAGSRKGLIEKWLKVHHNGLSGAAIKRITTIINPDKNGGVSASSE